MDTEMLNVRVTPEEKHALRKLAADDNLNISQYVLKHLRKSTPMKEVAASLAKRSPSKDHFSPDEAVDAAV